jgi:hypothetical protein
MEIDSAPRGCFAAALLGARGPVSGRRPLAQRRRCHIADTHTSGLLNNAVRRCRAVPRESGSSDATVAVPSGSVLVSVKSTVRSVAI